MAVSGTKTKLKEVLVLSAHEDQAMDLPAQLKPMLREHMPRSFGDTIFCKAVLVAMVSFASWSAHGKNIELANSEETCAKVTGYGSDDRFAIAKKFQSPMAQVQYLGARWATAQYGSKSCVAVFDTGTGPVRCAPVMILSSDNGKTAFMVVKHLFSDEPNCWR